MGVESQLATVALAARHASVTTVILGTTLGMMIADVAAGWFGEAVAHRVEREGDAMGGGGALFALGVLALFALPRG